MRKRIFALLSLSILIFFMTTNAHSKEVHEYHTVIKTYNTIASWYKHGKVTANGERFNPWGLTVAHRSLPFGTKLRLTNLETNKSIIVIVNDRGPFIRGRGLDVTLGCAIRLGMYNTGVTKLRVEIFR